MGGKFDTGCCLSIAAFAVALAGCSFDYSAGTADALLAQVPDTVLRNVTHVVVRDGVIIAEIRSELLENFSSDNRAVLTEVAYREFDRDGVVANHGRADRAVIHSETDDAEVRGAIHLRSETEEATLVADALRWNDAAKSLTSPREGFVQLEHDDGSEVSGRGLEIVVRHRRVRFEGAVSGTIVVED